MASPSIAAWRGDGNEGTPATSLTTSTPWSSQAGNPIIVFSNGLSEISDTLGNEYTICGGGAWAYCPASVGNGSGGAADNQITITFSSSTYIILSSWEIANPPTGMLVFVETGSNYVATPVASISSSSPISIAYQNSIVLTEASQQNTAVPYPALGYIVDSDAVFGGYAVTGHQLFSTPQTNISPTTTWLNGSGYAYFDYGVFAWQGSVAGNAGAAGQSATISWTGTSSGSVTADNYGNYTTPQLGAGTYTFTPSKTGVTFSPSSSDQTYDGSTPITLDFTSVLNSDPTDVVYTVTDTTIAASWTTAAPADSNIFAGDKPGLDNGFPQNVTSHVAIVAGLDPSTTYSCAVESGGASSAAVQVTTAPAQPRVAISSATNSEVTTTAFVSANSQGGDTFRTFLSNDDNMYLTEDDGYGIVSNTPNSGYATQVAKITDESAFSGGSSLLTNYGGFAETNGTDGTATGASSVALSNKSTGLIGLNGNLHMMVYRQNPPTYSTWQFLNWIKSPDHGSTWNNFSDPTNFVSGGNVLLPQTPSEPAQLYTALIGLAIPIIYAADDGTLGYATAGNGIDGANAYVYLVYFTTGGTPYSLARVPRVYFDAQTTTEFEYWVGSTSPSPADFTNDSNWSGSPASATNITTGVTADSYIDVVFIPSVNCYILTTTGVGNAFLFYSAPTPAGPWTQFFTQDNTAPGQQWYNPCPVHRDIATNTVQTSIPVRMLYSGNAGDDYYGINYSTFTLDAAAWNITGGCGVGGATISYSGDASGSVTADALGFYVIPDLAAGAYTVTPSSGSVVFNPASQDVTISDANVTANFSAPQGNSGSNIFATPYADATRIGSNSTSVIGTDLGTRII